MANADGSGCQINLDNGEGRILDGYVVDDIYAVSSYLVISFESPNKLLFGADPNYYFRFLNIDWCGMSFSEKTGTNKTWHYDMRCCPRNVFFYVTKPSNNTWELARALGLNLSDLSTSIKLPCPIINQYAGKVILANRLYSLEMAYNNRNLNEATYIYVNSKEMYSATWKSMTSQTALPISFPKGFEGGNLITYQDYQFDSIFSCANGAEVWKQDDFIGKMIGTQFRIDTTVPAVFLNVYTIKSEEIPEFDTGLPFLCVYSKRKLNEINAYTHYFANIKYMG